MCLSRMPGPKPTNTIFTGAALGTKFIKTLIFQIWVDGVRVSRKAACTLDLLSLFFCGTGSGIYHLTHVRQTTKEPHSSSPTLHI